MPARIAMRRTVRMGGAEKPHPRLCYLAPMGNNIDEPAIISSDHVVSGTVTYVTGMRGWATQFSSNASISTPTANFSIVGSGKPLSVMFFFRADSFAAHHIFLGNTAVANGFIRLLTTYKFDYGSSATIYARSTTQSIAANTWYHFAMTATGAGGGYRMYLNGVEIALELNSTYSAPGIGSMIRQGTAVVTTMDHIKVYNATLTSSEIVQEMNKINW